LRNNVAGLKEAVYDVRGLNVDCSDMLTTRCDEAVVRAAGVAEVVH
jgi:hypothetical protein